MFPREGGFQQCNVQPDRKSGLPKCPNYQLIEICALFADIDPNTLKTVSDFCGQIHEYKTRHEEDDSTPYTKCTAIRDELLERIRLAHEDLHLPDNNSNEASKPEELISSEKEEFFMQTVSVIRKYYRKQRLLQSWKKTVYELSCIPPNTERRRDPHFRRRTINELSDEEVLSTVEKYYTALIKNVTGKSPFQDVLENGDFGLWHQGQARHCEQSPR